MTARCHRRRFLRMGGTALALMGAGGLADIARAFSTKGTTSKESVLVVLFQRGAADGLHMVVPYRDRHYRGLRGGLALDEPGRGERPTLDLGDGFALHPALSPLFPLYSSGRLAFVVNVGSPDPTRSHFDAQDYMESGTPGRKATRDGWLSRALTAIDARSPFAAIALSASLPRSLAGSQSAMAMVDFSKLVPSRRGSTFWHDVEQMYVADESSEIAAMGEVAFAAINRFRQAGLSWRLDAQDRRRPPGQAAALFRQLASLLKADLGIRIACLSMSGWDTHFAQGGANGQMANLMQGYASGIAGLLDDVGTSRPLTLLSVTEFGRTVAVNGAGGTDHGHGALMMAAGSGVHGGRIVGEWGGLARENLYEGRDLPVTTDFRDLFFEVASHALGLEKRVSLFPDYRPAAAGVTSART